MKLTPEIAALYIGCDVQTKIRRATKSGHPMKKLKGELLEVDLGIKAKLGIHLEDEADKCHYEYLFVNDVKLLLRPLSSMTAPEMEELVRLELYSEEKVKEIGLLDTNVFYSWQFKTGKLWQRDYVDCSKPTAKQLLWLLQHRFDLFGLIADGAAQILN